MWIFNAIANAVGKNFIGTPNYLFGLLFNRVKADGGVTEAQQCTIEELTELQNDNLLSSASLVVTPSSYKEGKLYSVIPSDGSGDLSVTRATTATRVNSAGLVELVPYNLLTYSQTFSNVNWVKNEATISSNITTAPNGTLTASKLVENTANNSHHIYQNALANGVNTFSFYAKKGERTFVYAYADSVGQGKCFNLTSGTLGVNIIAAPLNATIESVGNDWFRCTITLSIASASALRIGLCSADGTFSYLGNGTSGAFIWGAQLNEGTSALDYFATETRLNIPRIDYSLGSCPSILVEPQRTNLALRSEQFNNNTAWTKVNATITADSTTAPNGTLTADSLIENTALTSHYIYQQYTKSATSITYTLSVYFKNAVGSRNIALGITNGTSSGRGVIFSSTGSLLASNITIGTGLGFTYVSAEATLISDGWYRATLVVTTDVATRVDSVYYLTDSTTLNPYLGNGTSSYFIWGAQLEAGAYATSYIPTTSASVTRNTDVLSRTNVYTNGWITASGGTWFLDLKDNIELIRASSSGGIFLNSGTFNTTGNGFTLRNVVSGIGRYYVTKVIGGVNTNLFATTTDTCKIAIKWDGATADVFVNGVKEVSATAFTPTAMENLFLDGTNRRAYINAMALWPTPLTDDELTALTTI